MVINSEAQLALKLYRHRLLNVTRGDFSKPDVLEYVKLSAGETDTLTDAAKLMSIARSIPVQAS